MQDKQADLERRIVRLERRNRWLTASCMVLAAAPLLLAFGVPKAPTTNVPVTPTPSPIGPKPNIKLPAPEVSEAITARKLTIVDDKNRPVIVLEPSADDGRITVHEGGGLGSTMISGTGLLQHHWKGDRMVETTSLFRGRLQLVSGVWSNSGELVIVDGSRTLTKLEASRLALHDAGGTQRASLAVTSTPFWRATLGLGDVHTGRVGLGASSDGAGLSLTPGSNSLWKVTAAVSSQRGAEIDAVAPSPAGRQRVQFPVGTAQGGTIYANPTTKDYLFQLYPNL